MTPKPVTRDRLLGKHVEFWDKRCSKSKRADNKYMIGIVKKISGKRKMWVSIKLPTKKKCIRIKAEWIVGTITHSGLRREIIW